MCIRDRLEQVNVKIASVLTDVFGVSGLNMLLALLEGKATPAEIAQLARGVAKRKVPQLIEAIAGNRMSDHVRFVIRSCLRHLACLEEELEEVDAEILRRMELPTFQKAFTLLQTIPGVGKLSAAAILAETGPDLDAFPKAEKLASWAGLCPGNRESAGIQKGSQTTHGNPYLRTALVLSLIHIFGIFICKGCTGKILPAELLIFKNPGELIFVRCLLYTSLLLQSERLGAREQFSELAVRRV